MTIGAPATYGQEADEASRYSIKNGEITPQEVLYNQAKRRRPDEGREEKVPSPAKRQRSDEGRGFVDTPAPPTQEDAYAREDGEISGSETKNGETSGSETENDGWENCCVSQRFFVLSLLKKKRYALGIQGDNGLYHILGRIPKHLRGAQLSELISSLKIPEVLKQAFLAEAVEFARKYPNEQPSLCVYVDETHPEIAAIPYTQQPQI